MATDFNYTASAKTALTLISKFGKIGAIRRIASTGTDPWVPSNLQQDYPCSLVIIEYTLKERENSLIQDNHKKVLVAASGLAIEPTEADSVVVDNIPHEIIQVKTVKPANTPVIHILQTVF